MPEPMSPKVELAPQGVGWAPHIAPFDPVSCWVGAACTQQGTKNHVSEFGQ